MGGNRPKLSGKREALTPWQQFAYFLEKVQGTVRLQDLLFSSPRAKRSALGLLLADGTPTGGRGEDFLSRQPDFFTETAVTSERKVEKSFPRWEINRHIEG